ncbi:MFS transporter [Methanosarcina sp.]|uniref:MFS transporter n=1 Tax=Methanosarcina sp. TaxID=2213 RepID=UPI003C746D03
MKVFLNKAETILINCTHAFLVLIGLIQVNKIQFLSNMANVLSILFIPVFARSLGASYFEVGLIVSVYSAATLLSSFIFGRLADFHRLRTMLLAGLGFSVAAFFLQVFASDPATLMLARAFTGFTVGVCPGALIAYVHYRKESLGRFISLGSLGWMAGFLLAGLIGENMDTLFLLSATFYLFCFLQALKLKDLLKPRLDIPYLSLDTLLKNSGVYFSLFLRHTGALGVWAFYPLYLRQLGASDFWIGFIYSINPAVQFLIMRRLDSFENKKLIHAGYLVSVIGFVSYALAPSYLYIIPSMFLVASAWAFLYVGSTRQVVELNPDKATAAGLINSMIGAAGVAGALLGGISSQLFGFRETALGAAILAISGLLFYKLFGDNFEA